MGGQADFYKMLSKGFFDEGVGVKTSVFLGVFNKPFNPLIACSACKVYTLKPAVRKHTAAQNWLCMSGTLQITTYLL